MAFIDLRDLGSDRYICMVTLPIERSKHMFQVDMQKRDDDV